MVKQSPDLDRMFFALADPTRRAIISQLGRGGATVSQIASPLPISLPAVVGHLNILERSGLISTRKQGRVRTCRIEPQPFEAAQAWLAQQRALWEARFDRMDAFILENHEPNERETP